MHMTEPMLTSGRQLTAMSGHWQLAVQGNALAAFDERRCLTTPTEFQPLQPKQTEETEAVI
jgi:hypothetical protein